MISVHHIQYVYISLSMYIYIQLYTYIYICIVGKLCFFCVSKALSSRPRSAGSTMASLEAAKAAGEAGCFEELIDGT